MQFHKICAFFVGGLILLNLSACGGGEEQADTNISVQSTVNQTTTSTDSPAQKQNPVQNDSSPITDTKPEEIILKPRTQTDASRFLAQATFGAKLTEINQLMGSSYNAWLDAQFSQPASSHYDLTLQIAEHLNRSGFPTEDANRVNPNNRWELQRDQESAWWHLALFAPDQLRQRVAFALSELLVVATFEDPLDNHAEAVAAYYDLLVNHAFGNYRDLLEAVSVSPAMGIYLSHQGNQKGDEATGRTPDENYAREVMQLFSLGLYELNLDGTPKKDDNQQLIPSYTQEDVGNLARVFTGWTRELVYTGDRFTSARNSAGGYNRNMECVNSYHDSGSKVLLGQTIAEGLLCQADLTAALDILFNHPNVGPYVSRHLIMRLVTSNPSNDYIERVSSVFNDDGKGVRGNLKAVVKAILLDQEARDETSLNNPTFGMLKNPVIATTNLLRPFKPTQPEGWVKVSDEIMTPMRSPSVFNFYSPDHQPIDNDFRSRNLVAPESSVYTDLQMTNHHNHLYQFIQDREIRELVIKDKENREPADGLFEPDRYYGEHWRNEVHIDLIAQYNLFKRELSGSENGNLDKLDNAADKKRALTAVLKQLNLLMTQNRLSDSEIDLILNYLMNHFLWEKNKEKRVIYLIQEAMVLIMPLPGFAVQK